jgi:dipeptidase E
MPTIVAIGGGELKDLETLPIDRHIVKLSGKKRPRVLFIPTASNDALGYWETFRDVYGKRLSCETEALFLVREKLTRKEIEAKILSSDIIYVGGGNTLRMLRVWRKMGVDKMLRKAYKQGIILAGLSAGAICWFRYGSSDSRRFSKSGKRQDVLMRVSGLGLAPFTVSPHHVREQEKRDPGMEAIMARTHGIGLALDDNSALVIREGRYEVVTSKEGAGVRKVFRKGKRIEWRPVEKSGSLTELLEKA